VLEEMGELEKDLKTFQEALMLIEGRCFEAQDQRYHPILDWQGADAALFTLKTCVQKINGVLLDYQDVLRRIDSGEIPNRDIRRLRLVEEEDG